MIRKFRTQRPPDPSDWEFGKKGFTKKKVLASIWKKYVPMFRYWSVNPTDRDLTYFHGMPIEEARKLYALLPWKNQRLDVSDCADNLMVRDLLELAPPGSLVFGFVVGHKRVDERFHPDGLFVPDEHAEEIIELLKQRDWYPSECTKGFHALIWDDGVLIESELYEKDLDEIPDHWAEYKAYWTGRQRPTIEEQPIMWRLWWG